jgi:hypothetical protein
MGRLGDAAYPLAMSAERCYTGHMARTRRGWCIASYKLTVIFSDGDRRLMGVAYGKGARGM